MASAEALDAVRAELQALAEIQVPLPEHPVPMAPAERLQAVVQIQPVVREQPVRPAPLQAEQPALAAVPVAPHSTT